MYDKLCVQKNQVFRLREFKTKLLCFISIIAICNGRSGLSGYSKAHPRSGAGATPLQIVTFSVICFIVA